ncbi:hypothetical protein I5Q39_16820 [Serratia marcescens]|nr:hypothetical protein [Serratia marcescens]
MPLLPPESVFAPCEQPQLQGETWGDAVSYALALQTSLHICAGQVETLNAGRATLPPRGRRRFSARPAGLLFLLLKRSFDQGYGALQSL